MGAGASTTARLRKIIIIRAYNTRPRDATVEEHFSRHWTRGADGKPLLTREDLRQAMDVASAPWLDPLLDGLLPKHVDAIGYDEFVRFLECGEMPTPTAMPAKVRRGSEACGPGAKRKRPPRKRWTDEGPWPEPEKAREAPQREDSFPRSSPSSSPGPEVDDERTAASASTSASSGEMEHVQLHGDAGVQRLTSAYMYGEVYDAMGFEPNDGDGVVVDLRRRGTELVVFDRKARLLRLKPTGRSLWRKREVISQQRVAHYTTIDEEGYVQELVETEKTQTEIMHIEAKDIGDFAHRESTNYEQTERFNGDLVNVVRGTEEYVHLKSTQDEYEHLESNMPPCAAPERPPSPVRPDSPFLPDATGPGATSGGGPVAGAGVGVGGHARIGLSFLLPYLDHMGGRVSVFAVTAEETFGPDEDPGARLVLCGCFLRSEAAYEFSDTLPASGVLRLLEDVVVMDVESPLGADLLNGLDETCMFGVPDVLVQLDKLLEIQVHARATQEDPGDEAGLAEAQAKRHGDDDTANGDRPRSHQRPRSPRMWADSPGPGCPGSPLQGPPRSPCRGGSPTRPSAAAGPRPASPYAAPRSPRRRPMSPLQRSGSPLPRPSSPCRRPTSPHPRPASPPRRPSSPYGPGTSPQPGPASPRWRPASSHWNTAPRPQSPRSPTMSPRSPFGGRAAHDAAWAARQESYADVFGPRGDEKFDATGMEGAWAPSMDEGDSRPPEDYAGGEAGEERHATYERRGDADVLRLDEASVAKSVSERISDGVSERGSSPCYSDDLD